MGRHKNRMRCWIGEYREVINIRLELYHFHGQKKPDGIKASKETKSEGIVYEHNGDRAQRGVRPGR
jgi:hypothetical protein